jgi:membrane protease YdiL (CAAX protease family)
MLGPGLVYAFDISKSFHLVSIQWIFFNSDNLAVRCLLDLAFIALISVWLWLVLRFVCWDTLASLNLKAGCLRKDVLHGCVLGLILTAVTFSYYFILKTLSHTGQTHHFSQTTEMLAAQPLISILVFVLTMWLSAAVFEEFVRAMLLSRLWKLGSSRIYLIATIAVAVVLFGLVHPPQDIKGVLGAILGALGLSCYYLVYGRVLPMIIAHGIYNTCTTFSTVIMYWLTYGYHR